MAEILFNVSLDLVDQYTPAEDITVVQEDNQSVKFLFTILNRESPVDLTSATNFKVSFIKQDGNLVLQDDATLVNGKVALVVNPEAFTYVGKVYFQVNYKISTANYNTRRGFMWVERGQTSCQTIQSTGFAPYLDTTVEFANQMAGQDAQTLLDAKQDALNAQQDISLIVLPKLDENSLGINSLDKKTAPFATPEMFGAVGNGLVDDTTALENMLNSSGNLIKLGRNKNYKITRKLKLTKSFTEIDLNGSTISLDSTTVISQSYDNKIFYIAPDTINVNAKRANVTSVGVYYKFGAMPEQIAGKFTVDDVSKFKVGDCVVIEYQTALVNTHTLTDLKPSVGTYAKILGIDAASKIVYTDYYTELDFRGLPPASGSGFMYVIDPVKRIKIKNGTLKSITPAASNKKDCAIRAEYVDGLTLEDIVVVDFNDKAIQPRWIRNVDMDNVGSDSQQGDKPLDYVVQCLELYNGNFNNIYGTTNTAILDFSFGCSYIKASNIESRNTGGSWGSIQLHGECEHDIMFENCSGFFSFANNTGEFPGFTYNITLQNCKGASYIMGCYNLRINDSDLIVENSDFSNLRVYGVSFSDSNIRLIRNVLYKSSTRGGNISPYLRFSNCDISPYIDSSIGLYKYNLIGFDEVSFSNNCRVFNNKPGVGCYFVLDAIKNFEFANSKNSGFLFSIRNNDGGTAAPFAFGNYIVSGSSIRITDDNCAVKAATTSLDWFLTFNNVSDLTGNIIFRDNIFSFNRAVGSRKWNFINTSNITSTSALKIKSYGNSIEVDTDFDLDVNLPYSAGYKLYYDNNNIDPINVNEYGSYRMSNYYPAIPTSGYWDIRKRILNRTPAVGQPKSWVCTASGVPGTWASEGNL